MLYAFCMLFLNRITNFYTSMGGTTVVTVSFVSLRLVVFDDASCVEDYSGTSR